MPHSAAAIRDLYSRNENIDIDKFPGIVSDYFQQEYSSSDVRLFCSFSFSLLDLKFIQQIPTLGLGSPPDSFEDGALVAFNSMIQDTSFSPELYLAKTANGDCG